MARLPQPGGDGGTWGNVLNDFLSQTHKGDGTLKDNVVTANVIAPNSVSNAAIASNAVNATSIADGSITETLLESSVRTKLNSAGGTPDWSAITDKPAVIAAGTDQPSARATIGAGTSDLALAGSGVASTAARSDHAHAKSAVGLGNVDNTSDVSKPISAAAQSALNLRAPLASPSFTGVVTVPTPTNSSDAATKSYVDTAAASGTPDATNSSKGKLQLAGDLGGSAASPAIARIQGVAVNGSSPSDGQVLTYSQTSSAWVPGTVTSTTVNDATTGGKGIVQLTGDLSGTASSPTVPGLASKLDTATASSTYAPKSNPTFTGVVTVPTPLFGTDAATKSYVDGAAASGTPDADVLTKGKIQLAGDLGGSATAPSVARLNGVAVSGTPTNGQVLTASGGTTAAWSDAPSAPVTSVALKTGAVTLDKTDVGLGNLDNTSDVNKPVSTATQAALGAKAALSHTHGSVDITDSTSVGRGLMTAADAAAARGTISSARDLSPQTSGAVGDGTADDTTAFSIYFAAWSLMIVRSSHRLNQAALSNNELRGEHFNSLKAATANPILKIYSGSTLRNITLDGEGSTSRRADVGGSGHTNIRLHDLVLINNPSNSFRVTADTQGVWVTNVYADGSKLFNTDDTSTPKHMIFSNNILVNGPVEGFLLDFPGSNSTWNGFVISSSSWESSGNSKRPIGLARSYGGVITGNAIRGAYSSTYATNSDLIHVEDKAQMLAVVGNVLESNGSYHVFDGASGGDPTYPQTDRNPKELLFTGNLVKATDSNTSYLYWLEGSNPTYFDSVTIRGETMMSNGVAKPMQVLAKSGVFGGNVIYDAPAQEKVRASDELTTGSAAAANIIRPQSLHVRPKFLRADRGHGFDPTNIVFRTSFNFDSQTHMYAWMNLVKTQTGATVVTTGGSLNGGTLTFPTDAATGAIYMRATRGASSDMTVRLDFTWDVHDIDFQQLDVLAARIMTKSSVQNAGKLELSFPNAGGSGLFSRVLNDGTDYASWKADGASKVASTALNFYAASAGIVKLSFYPGYGLSNNGDNADYGSFAISVGRSAPF